ncbi:MULTISPECIES: hypothetical protein [unclassified Saccharothrix]|uniref:hypothetical protein n=1 Tax=unclassified Saccharothrix TaxID=2593673 RepID=UPI00307E601E
MNARYDTVWLPQVAVANATLVLDMADRCALFLGADARGETAWYSPDDDSLADALQLSDDQVAAVQALLTCHALVLGEQYTHLDDDGEPVSRDLVQTTHAGRDLLANLARWGSN